MAGRNVPVVRTDTESEASGAEQECPRDDCECDPGATKMAEARDRRRREDEAMRALGFSLFSAFNSRHMR